MRALRPTCSDEPAATSLEGRPLQKVRFGAASRRVFRWVPDSLPLRFAALQASGKGLLRDQAPIPSAAFPGACSEAECDPGPSARSCREAAPNSFRRGLLKGEG